MQHRLTLLAITLLFTAVASAAPPYKSGYPGQRMVEQLNLQEEQVDQFKTIMQDHHDKMRVLMDGAFAKVEPEFDALHQETINQLSTVLTPEQLEEFQAMYNERKKNRNGFSPFRQGRFSRK
jgi:Spy/CpxP family protein refolding chaperone